MTSSTGSVERVKVNDWWKPRLVENRGESVAMEIARTDCSHCATCAKRMERVIARVHHAGLTVCWEHRGGGTFIVIPLPPGHDPVDHLAQVLDLDIVRCQQ